MGMLALRGAITCDDDTAEEIDRQTQLLITEMLSRNEIHHDSLVSVIFTATDDITAQFPAASARAVGLGDVPLLCARELGVQGSLARTIRVLMHFESDKRRSDLHHVYLGGARTLRDDLPE